MRYLKKKKKKKKENLNPTFWKSAITSFPLPHSYFDEQTFELSAYQKCIWPYANILVKR